MWWPDVRSTGNISSIRGADVILVMDGGRIVEQGNHDELIERNGPYAEL